MASSAAPPARTAGPLAPGAVIGIMGGGQLGRMTAMAAARLGYACHIFTPEAESPASQVAAATTVAAYDDVAALKAFAATCDVVTFEFENVPHESVQLLADAAPVRPSWECLRISQDRAIEKQFINDLGIPTAPWRRVESAEDLIEAANKMGGPSVLKTARMGYDGKGQVAIRQDTDLRDAWAAMGASVGVLEAFIDLAMEISVIVARGVGGTTAAYVPVENRHANHILDTTLAPAAIDDALAAKAVAVAETVVGSMDLVGLLAVEMFVTRDGRLLVNEIAPRPHNSGHWTIDACQVSQFEQFVRAVAGLPLGDPERHSDARMQNLIGRAANDWLALASEPGASLHLYGKREARPGRKMGHVTRLFPKGALPRS